jgi:uncharacterized cupin superfamily protein
MRVTIINPSEHDFETSPVDKERLIEGNPMQQLANVLTNKKENFFVGVWRSEKGKWTLNYTEDEFCYLVKGHVVIEDEAGNKTELKAGQAFTIEAGFKGSWHTLEDCEKFYAIYEE